MPRMPDAEVLVHGTALLSTPRPLYVNDKLVPGGSDGADVTILGPQGMAIARFRQEHIESGELPQLGQPVALVTRGSSWAGDRGAANVVYGYVRRAGADELDELHKTIKAAGG